MRRPILSSWRLDKNTENFETKTHLKLDYFLLIQTQIHAIRVFEVEGAFMQLADGVIRVQQNRLFVHFADDLQVRGRILTMTALIESEIFHQSLSSPVVAGPSR